MYLTEIFGQFIADLRYEDLPEEITGIVKERIMDSMGAVIAGSASWDYSEAFQEVCRKLGSGNCRVVGSRKKEFPPARAAMIDAVYAHSVELDDGHKNCGVHAGSVVVPTALVLGEVLGRTGKEIIAAVAAGYETAYRVGVYLRPDGINRGFHPSSNCDTYGAAAAAGKLLRLNAEQLAAALGQAGMFSCGTMENTHSGQRSKCVMVGQAAFSGIMAAYMAEAGMEGCVTALEGPAGTFMTQAGRNKNAEETVKDLGKAYILKDTYNKMYPSCRHAQPGIEGVLDLVSENGIRPEDVAEIRIGTHQVAFDLTGSITAPQDSGQAKFSLSYGAAAALLDHGFGVAHLGPGYYTRPDLLEFAKKVTVTVDPEVQAVYPGKRGAKVCIVLKDGRTFGKELYDLKGSPDNPVGFAELKSKFMANAVALMPKEQAEKLVEMFASLDSMDSVRELMELM